MNTKRSSSKMMTAAVMIGVIALLIGCQTLPDPLQDAASAASQAPIPNVTIDSAVVPAMAQISPLDDGQPRLIAALRGEDGTTASFVENELIVSTDDAEQLAAFLLRTGGVEIATFDAAHYGLDCPSQHLVRITAPAADLDALRQDLAALNPEGAGDVIVSSLAAQNLIGAAARETRGGLSIGINFLSQPQGIRERTITDGNSADGFTFSYNTTSVGERCGVGEAWRTMMLSGRAANRIPLAVIDGGFDRNMNDFQSWRHVWFNPVADPYDTSDYPCSTGGACNWHGTEVASVAAGIPDNGIGVAGTGGQVVDLITIRRGYEDFFIAASLGEAKLQGARIVNMSFGAELPWTINWATKSLDPVTKAMRDSGILLFAASGNDGHNLDRETCVFGVCWPTVRQVPGECPGVICVGGVATGTQSRAQNSNYGKNVVIHGPYTVMVAPTPENPTVHSSNGTSVASPFVAGCAAMVWAVDPSRSADDVERILFDTAWPGMNGATKIINAHAGVVRAIGSTPPTIKITSPPFADALFGRNLTFSCNAHDREDGPVQDVVWTSDRMGQIGTGEGFRLETMPLGHHVITALATDSTGLSTTDSVSVDLKNVPPRVNILEPNGFRTMYAGQTLSLRGWSFDDDAGHPLPNDRMTWTSDLQGLTVTGTNASMILTALGTHNIELVGVDLDGARASKTVSVAVLPPPPEGVPPTVSPIGAEFVRTDPLGFDDDFGLYYTDIHLTVQADDAEDGVLGGTSVVWSANTLYSVDGGSPCQCGSDVTMRIWMGRDDTRTIHAFATDSSGQTAESTLDVAWYPRLD